MFEEYLVLQCGAHIDLEVDQIQNGIVNKH